MRTKMLLIGFLLTFGALTSQAQTSTVKKQILNKLIEMGELTQEKVTESGDVNSILEIKSVDLNRDGKPEFIVSCWCSLGQTTFVFRKTASGVENIFSGDLHSAITPLRSYTKGWRNLRSTVYRSVDGATSSETLRWNGSEYK